MTDQRLQERLRRLRHASAPTPLSSAAPEAFQGVSPTPASLVQLEESLIGEIGEGLPLKQRLERLVVAAGARERVRACAAPRQPIEDFLPAREVENAHGRFLIVEESRALDALHGALPLARLQAIAPHSTLILSGEEDHADFHPSRAVFVDTETTGLAGGAGTAAFLVGIGFIENERFCVRQYFMRDYDEEPALLHALAEDLARFSEIVTFNGKMFDVPLLETRFRLNRARFPLAHARHLDLLHPARRLWKARLESCRLKTLESELLGFRREGDIPGEEIPHVYFDYVRRREGRTMSRVFEHNCLDIVSLAALTALACQWIEERLAEDPRDILSLARVLESARLFECSENEYRRVVERGDAAGLQDVRLAALVRLARRKKRSGDSAAATTLWKEAARAGFLPAFRELAIHHEHALRDPMAALAFVEEGLARSASTHTAIAFAISRDFLKRRERLRHKLAALDPARYRQP